jgi:signal transduction histidine kinase
VNDAWALAAQGGSAGPTAPLGANYLEAVREVASRGERDAEQVLQGLLPVLDHAAPGLSIEYRLGPPADAHWFELLAEPLRRSEGGAVVTLVDVTHRKRAEIEASRLREDLAHMARVSTLGELAASLAHELNQPLTAILSNAQTALLLMGRPSPDLGELREILTDVVRDDERAGQVIRRLNALFKKGDREKVRLDVNELIREVLRLLQNDVALRSASLRMDLDPGLPLVEGDRIQLQQVILNLAVNGLDAMHDQPPDHRHLTIRSRRQDGTVRIEVADSGRGVEETDQERVFQPFYTTKPTGMGMGLTVSRSIVEAHGGNLALISERGEGATFRVTLPAALARQARAV